MSKTTWILSMEGVFVSCSFFCFHYCCHFNRIKTKEPLHWIQINSVTYFLRPKINTYYASQGIIRKHYYYLYLQTSLLWKYMQCLYNDAYYTSWVLIFLIYIWSNFKKNWLLNKWDVGFIYIVPLTQTWKR